MKKDLLPFAFLLAFSCTLAAQVWSPQAAGILPDNYDVADISIVNDQVIWATAIDYSVGPPVPSSFVTDC